MKILGVFVGFQLYLVITPIFSFKIDEIFKVGNRRIIGKFFDLPDDAITCIPPVVIENINEGKKNVLPSYVRYKKDCKNCCRNPLFDCTTSAMTIVPVTYHEISSSNVYLGEKTKHVFTVTCHCTCKISQRDCPTGSKFNSKLCLCLSPQVPFTSAGGTC